MGKRGIFVLFLLLLSINLVYAAPPFQQTTSTNGIQIETPVIETHRLNSDYDFHIHAHNISNGLLLTNTTTSCIIHIYEGISGEHIINRSMVFSEKNLVDFELDVSGSNFSEVGEYAVLFYCNVGSQIGGFFEYSFEVTRTGGTIDSGESMRYIAFLVFVLVFLSLCVYVVIITPYDNIGEITKNGKAVTKVTKTKYVKLFAIWLSYGLFMLFIIVLTGMINNYTGFGELRNLMTGIYLFLNVIWYGLSICMVWLIFYNIWKDIILNKTIIREGKALLNSL